MKLKILTWNISYGYGLGSEGFGNYEPHTFTQYEENLNQISAAIKAEAPDVVLLQEVDFNSARSFGVDQLAYLARSTGILYRDKIVSWDLPYVPHPLLQPKKHFGRMRSGGGILSRFPIHSMQNDLLPKPRENSRAYNFFYLWRYLQIVQLKIPGLAEPFTLTNLHLEAFAKENRALHLIKLQNRLIDYSIDVAGGDFNGTISLDPNTLEKGWSAVEPNEATFPSNEPIEKLDGFVLKNGRVTVVEKKVLNTGTCSDHLPILIHLEIK